MPLEDRNLERGTVLHARYKGKERTCEVVQTADGLRYRLDDGREFSSPSSAGKAAMGGVSCNGWRFWSIAGTEKLKRKPETEKTATSVKAKTRKAASKKSAATKTGAKGAERQGRAARVDGRIVGLRRLRPNLRATRAATNHATPHPRS
jgi:leucyl aminopeptidase (aminopeptidase T)